MKKLFLVLSVVFFASGSVFATNLIKVIRITDSIQITTPDGESAVYKSIEDIPELVYGSKILAAGGTAEIKIFNTASVTLEKNQKILILKHPVSKEIEVSKIESKSKNLDIKVWLADHVSASFGSDTKVTFFEQYPSIIFKVTRGAATVKGIGGRTYELTHGEYYEAKQNILQ